MQYFIISPPIVFLGEKDEYHILYISYIILRRINLLQWLIEIINRLVLGIYMTTYTFNYYVINNSSFIVSSFISYLQRLSYKSILASNLVSITFVYVFILALLSCITYDIPFVYLFYLSLYFLFVCSFLLFISLCISLVHFVF